MGIRRAPEEEEREKGIGKLARASIERAKAEIELRLDRLLDLKTSPANADDSLVSESEYGRRRKQILVEKQRCDERSTNRDRVHHHDFEKVRATLQLASGVGKRF
jgi:hypothetical protein